MENLREDEMLVAEPQTREYDLTDRFLDFAADTIKMCYEIPRSDAGRHIGIQLIRSCSSMGANYEEGCAAQSRADFIHKLQISHKESREPVYWMRLVGRLKLVPDSRLDPILREANELKLILAKSVATAKGQQS